MVYCMNMNCKNTYAACCIEHGVRNSPNCLTATSVCYEYNKLRAAYMDLFISSVHFHNSSTNPFQNLFHHPLSTQFQHTSLIHIIRSILTNKSRSLTPFLSSSNPRPPLRHRIAAKVATRYYFRRGS